MQNVYMYLSIGCKHMYSIYVRIYKYTKHFIVEKQPVGVNETLVQTCIVSIDICEQNWNF
jgi:hypothetical protein